MPAFSHANEIVTRDLRSHDVQRPWLEASTSSAASAKSFNPAELLVVVRRWWWQGILAGVVLAMISSAVVWLTFRRQYESAAYLRIKRDTVALLEQRPLPSVFPQTQLEIIRSPVVLKPVSIDEQVASLPEAIEAESIMVWLKANLRVSYLNASELCEISFRSRNPNHAALVVNTIVNVYSKQFRKETGEDTTKVIELLKSERAAREQEIATLKDRLAELTKKNGGSSSASLVDPNRNTVVLPQDNPIHTWETLQATAEVKRIELEAELKTLQDAIESGKIKVPDSEIENAIHAHPEIASIESRLLVARAKLHDYEKRATPNPRDTIGKTYRDEISDLEALLKKVRGELRKPLAEELERQLLAEQSRVVEEKQAAIDKQRDLEEVWQARINKSRQEMTQIGGESLEWEFTRRDLERTEDVYRRIADRMMIIQTERGLPPPVILLKEAEPAEQPLEAIPWKRFAMAVLGSLVTPFGLAFVWERTQRRIVNSQQLASESNLPVLGEVTMLPTRLLASDRNADERFQRDRLTFQESVDSLCAALTLAPELRDVQTLAVASAVSQEGKTSLAFSLAVSLARSTGESTLLIDADLRAPDLHAMLDRPLAPGLADVLGRSRSLEEAIVSTDYGIHFLSAGVLATNPHLLLRDGGFAGLLQNLTSRYRHVIIDSPPVLSASESLVIASSAQGVVLCALRDVSRGPQLRTACQRLSAVGAKLLGTVISGVPTSMWAYKHGGYGYAWESSTNPLVPAAAEAKSQV